MEKNKRKDGKKRGKIQERETEEEKEVLEKDDSEIRMQQIMPQIATAF